MAAHRVLQVVAAAVAAGFGNLAAQREGAAADATTSPQLTATRGPSPRPFGGSLSVGKRPSDDVSWAAGESREPGATWPPPRGRASASFSRIETGGSGRRCLSRAVGYAAGMRLASFASAVSLLGLVGLRGPRPALNASLHGTLPELQQEIARAQRAGELSTPVSKRSPTRRQREIAGGGVPGRRTFGPIRPCLPK